MVVLNRWGFIVFSEEHRQKMSQAKLGNQNGAKPYPAFVNQCTGEVIPAGFNLSRMCRERGLCRPGLQCLVTGKRTRYKDWVVAEGDGL